MIVSLLLTVLMIPVLDLLLEALCHSIASRAELRIIVNMISRFLPIWMSEC